MSNNYSTLQVVDTFMTSLVTIAAVESVKNELGDPHFYNGRMMIIMLRYIFKNFRKLNKGG